MNIAYLLPSLAKQGPVVVAYELAILMLQKGHTVSVYYFDEYKENVLSFPCPVFRIGFWQRIDFNRFDVVHSHGLRPDAYVFLHKPVRRTATRFITTIHNFVLKDFTTQYNRMTALVFGNLWMLMLCRNDMRVVLSRTALQYYRRWFGKRRIAYVYNTRTVNTGKTLDEKEMAELESFRGNDRLLGINAMLTHRKGVDMVLRALPDLEHVKLFIVGDGKEKESLQAMARQEGVADRVRFAGYREDAYRYIPHYDIYMMPSRSEGFPLAMLEAAIFSRPSVCSDIPVFREIFIDKEVSFFRLEDISSLVEAILHAFKEGTTMGERMHLRYKTYYSPKQFCQGYLSVYEGY